MEHVDELNGLIRDAVDRGYRGPQEIADEVLYLLDGEQAEYLFLRGLRHHIAEYLRRHRSTPQQPPKTSPKHDGIRDVIASGLFQVSLGRNQWKALRNCTAADLQAAADRHLAYARHNETVANRYLQLRQILIDADVDTVADVDEQVVRAVMHGDNDDVDVA